MLAQTQNLGVAAVCVGWCPGLSLLLPLMDALPVGALHAVVGHPYHRGLLPLSSMRGEHFLVLKRALVLVGICPGDLSKLCDLCVIE